MVTEQGIEVIQDKVAAIMNMVSPINVKEVQSLNGRNTALSRFISRFADKRLPFYKVLRQHGRFEWTEECQKAFGQLKYHFAQLSLLVKPIPGEILILYFVVWENSVSFVLIKEDEGIQKPVYFVSKALQGAEARYAEIEKTAQAIITTAKKLRPYFLSHKVIVRTSLLCQQVLGKPEVSRRMVK